MESNFIAIQCANEIFDQSCLMMSPDLKEALSQMYNLLILMGRHVQHRQENIINVLFRSRD